MKWFNLFMIISLLFVVSCSNMKKEGDPAAEATEDASVDDDFIVDAEDDSEELDEEADTSDSLDEEVEAVAEADDQSAPEVQLTGDMGEYTVEEGDTLMWISFKLYGNYLKWRKVVQENPTLDVNGDIPTGTVIKYKVPAEKFAWSPEGDPYLIKRGDTLGYISKDKYGTMTKWKSIYENNSQMIKDPNLIFAGFTLYYVPDTAGSDVAMK